MRRARRRLLQTAAILAAASLFALPAVAQPSTVILLSWDGVRHDYPDLGRLPGLERMGREGARAKRLVPVFPTNTFPNHVSLATGAPPDVHGIVGNVFREAKRGKFDYDNDASWIEAEPLWVAAERQGVRAATFFWVGSETDWRGVGASYRKAPFAGGILEAKKVGQILSWLDLPERSRPRLIMSWWHGADSTGHRHGPDDRHVAQQMRVQDKQLLRLLAGLDARGAWSRTTLMIVSDHGMSPIGAAIDLRAQLLEAGIGAEVITGGGVAHVHLDDPARREEALAQIGALPDVRAYPSDAVPATLRYTRPGRTGHLVALTTPPHYFAASGSARIRAATSSARGGHGYAADHPDMGGVFLAIGRGVPAGRELPAVSALDVAPTVARLLAMQPPLNSEGAPIPGIGGAR